MLQKILTYSFLILFISCSKDDTEINNSYTSENIYLSGSISADSIYMSLTRSASPYISYSLYQQHIDPYAIYDTLAVIEVFENDILFCRLTPKSNVPSYADSTKRVYYVSHKKPNSGSTYKVKAKYKDKLLEASVFIPKPVCIISIDTSRVETVITSGPYTTTIKGIELYLNFQDPVQDVNYYLVSNNLSKSYGLYFDSSIPLIESENANKGEIFGRFPVFSDRLINGKKYKVSAFANDEMKEPYIFRLYSINSDWYKYMIGYNKYIAAEKDSYSEPITLFSNEKNGFGLVGGYSYSEVVIYPSGKFEVLK